MSHLINPSDLPERLTVTWTACDVWTTKTGKPVGLLFTRSEDEPFCGGVGPRVWLPPVDVLGALRMRDVLGDFLYASDYDGPRVRAFYRLLARERALPTEGVYATVGMYSIVGALRPLLVGREAVLVQRTHPDTPQYVSYAPLQDPRVRVLPPVRVTFDLTQTEDPA